MVLTKCIMAALSRTLNLQICFIILSFCAQILLSDCPRLCECKWKSGKESVICMSANLTSIPLHLEAGTQVLDLTANNLNTIKNDEFRNAGVVNLQKIYISKCRLKTLERYSFRNLINLVELDISYNALSSIPSQAFGSIPELRDLKLSGNPIQRISNFAFTSVPQLVRLELSDCKIGTIENRAFSGLENLLEWLKLDRNKLTEVNPGSFTIFQNLNGLELTGNPWNCSCSLRPLREWMLRKNVPFDIPPVCRYPGRLSGKSWDKLELDEFACIPEILALDPKANGIEGKNVTMTCHIAGIPEPNVRWLLKNKVIANLSGTPYSNGKKLYVVHIHNNSSYLTILTADVQDAGVYVCAAENKAGRAEASVTLAVSRRPPENTLNAKVIVASVIAATLFVLTSCVVVLCVWTVRKKQVAQWRERNCRREDNYEKIEMNHKVVSGFNVKDDVVQGDLDLAGQVRRNGDYRLVPVEAEQDIDKDDETTYEASASKKRDTNALNSNRSDLSAESRWNSPELPLLDTEDLHIPRRTIKENRDDCKKSSDSTSGIYNNSYRLNTVNTQGPLPPQTFQTHFMRKQHLEGTGGIYTSAFNTELSSLTETDAEKKIPDLIEGSSSIYKPKPTNTAKANSEGGSVSDISDLYCTLPRKHPLMQKEHRRYHSSDSQSPLLPESRYGSSGGDSSPGSQISSARRLSDSHKYSASNLNCRVNQRASSYLNLTSPRQASVPPSPIHESQTPSSTPLLDVTGLDNRVSYRREILSPVSSPIVTSMANTYDYHAAQLERFLEEYRSLQKELTKMKETCDNLTKEKAPGKLLDPLQNSLSMSPLSESANTNKQSSAFLPNSPNSNQTLDNSMNCYESNLSKYLLSYNNSSPRTFNSGGTFNN